LWMTSATQSKVPRSESVLRVLMEIRELDLNPTGQVDSRFRTKMESAFGSESVSGATLPVRRAQAILSLRNFLPKPFTNPTPTLRWSSFCLDSSPDRQGQTRSQTTSASTELTSTVLFSIFTHCLRRETPQRISTILVLERRLRLHFTDNSCRTLD